jgi:hypothetical protein
MCGLNGLACFRQCWLELYWLALVSALLAGAAMAFAIIEFKEVIKK